MSEIQTSRDFIHGITGEFPNSSVFRKMCLKSELFVWISGTLNVMSKIRTLVWISDTLIVKNEFTKVWISDILISDIYCMPKMYLSLLTKTGFFSKFLLQPI